MTDHRSRLLEKAARQGLDPASGAAHLAARLRAGTLTLERVQLAAFCLDEAATLALGWPGGGEVWSARGWRGNYDGDLSAWVYDLGTWADVGPVPGWVLVRAQAASARAVVAAMHARKEPTGLDVLLALESAEAWLDEPGAQARSQAVVDWSNAWGEGWPGGPHANLWLPILPDWASGKWSAHLTPGHAICGAARLAGETPVRAAICASLTEWALS